MKADYQAMVGFLFLSVFSAVVFAADLEPVQIDSSKPLMYYTDISFGGSFAKDPDVVRFKGRYYMYYTTHRGSMGIAVGVAVSDDLINWTKIGDMLPAHDYEKKGLGAPAAIVIDKKVHLFYQTYGNGPKDAICHAVSEDAVHFQRNETNPIFSPAGDWTCGRAIDAEAIVDGSRMLLYWATRDPNMNNQMLGVSCSSMASGFIRDGWKQISTAPLLKPDLPWEGACIEAASVFKHNDRFYMFYAGSYNATPQQIGIAVSNDGQSYQRMSDDPLLPNGLPGTWNAHESGHPGVFVDDDGSMYLFYQGTNDKGKTWYLSRMDIHWDGDKPYLVQPGDGKEFHLK